MEVLSPQSANAGNNRKKVFIIVLLIFLVLFSLFGIWFWQKYKKTNQNWSEANNINAPQVIKTEVEKKELPKNFPTDFPEEPDARITQNYLAETKDKRFQATRVYESKLSLEDNQKKFKDYLASKQWQITAETNESNIKLITAKKDKQLIQIGISKNSLSQVVAVEATIIEVKN